MRRFALVLGCGLSLVSPTFGDDAKPESSDRSAAATAVVENRAVDAEGGSRRVPFDERKAKAEKKADGDKKPAEKPKADNPAPDKRLVAEKKPDVKPASAKAYWIGAICLPTAVSNSREPVLRVAFVAPDSPAAKAGLKIDDVVSELDGARVADPHKLHELVERSQGKLLKLSIVRSGQKQTLEVTPAERPGPEAIERLAEAAEREIALQAKRQAETDAKSARERHARESAEQKAKHEEQERRVAAEARRQAEQLAEQAKRATETVRSQASGTPQIPLSGSLPGAAVRPLAGQPQAGPLPFNVLPDDVTVTVTKSGRKPATVRVERGDERWDLKENEIDRLPRNLQGPVGFMLGRNPWMPATTTYAPHAWGAATTAPLQAYGQAAQLAPGQVAVGGLVQSTARPGAPLPGASIAPPAAANVITLNPAMKPGQGAAGGVFKLENGVGLGGTASGTVIVLSESGEENARPKGKEGEKKTEKTEGPIGLQIKVNGQVIGTDGNAQTFSFPGGGGVAISSATTDANPFGKPNPTTKPSTGNDELQMLKKQVEALQRRVEELSRSQSKPAAKVAPEKKPTEQAPAAKTEAAKTEKK